MSLRTLPILFFNLGGEMLYILEQRLKAQHVLPERATRVMRDIASQMFEKNSVRELFKPQKVLTKNALKVVFEKLAHASIMTLNGTAMEKLYNLMLMAVKYQLLLCQQGEDVVMVTLNHLDAIRLAVGSSKKHIAAVDEACKAMTECYSELTAAQFTQLRYTLLSVFQDTHKRVSVFLNRKAQSANGRFILPKGGALPFGVEQPGAIRYYDEQGVCVETERFTAVQQSTPAQTPGSWDLQGDRGTTLGTNMYASDEGSERTPEASTPRQPVEEEEEGSSGDGGDTLVKAELDLLEKLLKGFHKQRPGDDTFKLKLFPHCDEDSDGKPRTDIKNVLHINPSKKGNDPLLKIADEFSMQQPQSATIATAEDDDDVMDLLDSTS